MTHEISRRAMVKGGLIAGTLAPVLGLLAPQARGAALTPLDPADPQAKALGFAMDSSKVDGSKFATHKPNQKCGNCQQFQGKAADATAACTIFAGHSVPQGGWCQVWTQKPGT
jgi:High potential iron-sulfur protein